MLKYEVDIHCHTIASGHAYSTIKENAEVAAEKRTKDDSYNRSWACHGRRYQ